jgi:hypothetical protein
LRLIVVVCLAWPTAANAKPKVAVAPLDDDADDKIADVVADEAAEHAKVTSPQDVAKTMESLRITDTHTPRARKTLRIRLEVDALIHGKVERDGKDKKLVLTVSGRAKKGTTFELKFKTKSSKPFRKELRAALAKGIASATEGSERDDDTDDDDEPRKKDDDDERKRKQREDDEREHERKRHDDEERERKRHEDDERKRRDDDDRARKKRVADDDSRRTHRRSDDDDDDRRSSRKKRHRRDGVEPERNPITQAAMVLDGGAAGMRRSLTWDMNLGMAPPPTVGTASFSGRIEGEVYPGAFDTLEGTAAHVGIVGSLRKTFGLSIAVPGTAVDAPIKEGAYTIGARYRFVFGSSSLALGVSFWRQYYIADRSALAAPNLLDMPDVEYAAVAPGAIFRFAAGSNLGAFVGLDVPLLLSAGPIGTPASYGAADAIAFAVDGGVDYMLGPHYGLRFTAVFHQVGLGFKQTQDTLAARRGVVGATDRTMGIAAAFAVFY